MDDLTYSYVTRTNRLDHVGDNVSATNYEEDIDGQAAGNFEYDAIGNLIKDSAEGITSISWTVYGKIWEIKKGDSVLISYTYDPGGNRISKTVNKTSPAFSVTTWYSRDAQGNVMSVYEAGKSSVNGGHLTQTELHLYGSSRLGLLRRSLDVDSIPTPDPYKITMPIFGEGDSIPFARGNKLFELSNHLGNVLVTVNDKKLGISSNNSTVDYFNPQVASARDYYPFGMLQPGRSYNAGGYRFGFNGKENDNEVKGEGMQQDYGMRVYDTRLGKFLSVDPLIKDYPWYTPYQFSGNKPIWAVDLDGLEENFTTNIFKAFFGSPRSYSNPRTPLEIMTKDRLLKQEAFANSRAGKFGGGTWNFTTGTVGTIGSVSYMVASDGAGAALGGTIALQFSLGEMAIGTSQMLDAVFSKKTNDALQSSGSIPGLIAYETGSKYAPFIDALGQFTPTVAMAGTLKGLVTSGLGVIDAAKSLRNTPSVANAIGLLDQISDTEGFVLESFNLANDVSGGRLKQSLSFSFSYIVQKGENLTDIAKKFYTTVEAISITNRITDKNKIKEGQKLRFRGFAGGSSGGAGSTSDYKN
jgi:RHS repeat-associated protein